MEIGIARGSDLEIYSPIRIAIWKIDLSFVDSVLTTVLLKRKLSLHQSEERYFLA